MKIDISKIDTEQFAVDEHIINGELCYLVQPKALSCNWNQSNKIFRSSLWNSEGELISASFPKFVNWSENPENFPVPTSLNKAVVMEKLDGSTLIISKYKGQFIIRTRGTIDATNLEKNGFEISYLLEKYPVITKGGTTFYNSYSEDWEFSLIFEWTSPFNQIVLNYGDEADIKLIGIIEHRDYSLWNQVALNDVAKQLGVGRPATYQFDSIEDLISDVQLWDGKEGVCVYSKGGQEIHKVKSFQYLKLHYFKSNATYENTVELFFEFGMPDYKTFEAKLIEKFDYECYQMVRNFVSVICEGYKDVLKIVAGMQNFVDTKLKPLSTRRQQAEVVFSSYGKESNRSAFVFTLLDGHQLDKEKLKKLLYQVTKK